MTTLVVGAIETNCYLIPARSGGAIVIDPGDNAPLIIERLRHLGIAPRYIILTHGHFDHLAALPALMAHFAAEPPLLAIHHEDARYVGAGAYQEHCRCFAAASGGDTSFIDMLWQDMPESGLLLNEGDTIEQLRVLHLPGHSAGSIALYDEAGANGGALFSGDTLFRGGFGRTDLPGGDRAQLTRSLKRLFEMPPSTRVFSGHGGPTTIGSER